MISFQFAPAVVSVTQQMASGALAQSRRAELSLGVISLRQWTQAATRRRHSCVALLQLVLRLWVFVRTEASEETPNLCITQTARNRPWAFVHCSNNSFFARSLYRLESQ